jgi:predicted RecA/RadA family phage recombinase
MEMDMKNYVQSKAVVTLAAPYAVTSGAGALVGTLFGVAGHDAANGAQVDLHTVGVFDLVKIGSQAWTVGALIYWDNTSKACTTVVATNTLIGKAIVAVGSGAGETIGRVRLDG